MGFMTSGNQIDSVYVRKKQCNLIVNCAFLASFLIIDAFDFFELNASTVVRLYSTIEESYVFKFKMVFCFLLLRISGWDWAGWANDYL